MNKKDIEELIFKSRILKDIQKIENDKYFSSPPNISQLSTAFVEILIPYTWMVYNDNFGDFETAKREGMEAYLNEPKFHAFINTANSCFVQKAQSYTNKWLKYVEEDILPFGETS